MMPYLQFKEEFENAVSKSQGFVALRCNDCDSVLYWFDTDPKYFYETRYTRPCMICESKIQNFSIEIVDDVEI
jgi:hypothetical protein